MSRAEFAKHRGVSRAAVTQWAAAGRLVLAGNGDVLVDESDAMLVATLNTRGGKDGKGPNGAKDVSSAHDAGADAGASPGPAAGGTLTQARTDQARAKARLDELEYRKRAGELVERTRSDRAILDALVPIIGKLDALPTQLAPKLAGMTDIASIQNVIEDGVADYRQNIAETLRAIVASHNATHQ